MSNYLSSPFEQTKIESTFNAPLADKVLSVLQGKYDANKAQIDQTLALYKNQLKGRRDVDNQYIAERLKEAENTIKSYGNRDFSLTSTTDTLLNNLQSITEDPIIRSAVLNKAKVDQFNLKVDEIKKKGDGRYADENYQDALDLAGVSKYDKGETKDIGNLEYNDYVNAPKEIDTAVAKWAKDNGYQTQINHEDKGLYFINTKSEVLTKKEILNYIDIIVDPKIKTQMGINARASYGRMDDSTFNETAKNIYKQDSEIDAIRIAELQAEAKTKSGAELDGINSAITTIETRKKLTDEKINAGIYDRNDQYKFYQNNLYGSIAEAYDRNNIVDIDYNTTALEIAKFKFDVEYKTKDLELKQKANKIASGEALGTAIPTIPEEESTPKSNISQIKTNVVQTEADLKNLLAKEDPDYKKLTTLVERNAYIVALMKSDGVVNLNSKKPLSNNIVVAIKNHKNNYEAFSTYISSTKDKLDGLAREQYNDMLNAKGLNLTNLSRSMPITTSFLKTKKPFSKLTPQEQDLVNYERGAAQLQFDIDLNDSDRESITTYLNRIKSKNLNNKTFQDKVKNIDLINYGSEGDSFVVDFLGGTILKGIKNAIIDPVYDFVADTYDYATLSESEADKNANVRLKEQKQDFNDIGRNSDRFNKVLNDQSILFAGREDTNITEVDTRGDSKSGKDLSKVYRDVVKDATSESDKILSKYLPTIPEKSSFSFSTANKAQQPTAIVLGQIVQKNGGGTPGKGENNYNIEYFAQNGAYKISYLDSKGAMQTTPFIDKKLMPEEIVNKYQTSLSNWGTDLKNPKATLPVIQYTKPMDRAEGEKMIETLARTNPDTFSDQELYMLMDSPMFQESSVMLESIYKTHPEIKGNLEKEAKIRQLFNSTIKTRSRRYNENTFQIQTIFLDGQNKEIGVSKWENVGGYDEINNLKIQLLKTSQDFNDQINKIIQ